MSSGFCMKKPKVSVIIVSWNTKKLLYQCLESLNPELEIVVVDNASNDGSSKMVEKEFPRIMLIKNSKNLGFARANNQGIKLAKGDYIMLLNSDTIIHKEAIEKLVDFLLKNKHVAAVSPLLFSLNGLPQIDYYMKFPNLWQVFLYHNRFFRPIALRLGFLRARICYSPQKAPFPVDQLPGAALMASREVWQRVGLLDEDYQFLYEDVDWCWRAKEMGYRLMVIPEAKITHVGGASWKQKISQNSTEFYQQYFLALLLFVKKNYGKLKWEWFKKALVISFLIRFKFRLARYFSQINL